uniref:Uncharacterized protein n=1 Tax=Clandestinovirus TaxID=2831644 RepID=A0A8F8KR61_9VIRU|nr:hypothetical protein KOM_12_228 [Clandestinovirus]
MTSIPSEVLRIIHKKSQIEWNDKVIKIFEDFIIPYLYHASTYFADPYVSVLGNLSLSYFTKTKRQYESHFVLTAIRRICKRLANDVSYGAMGDVFGGINRYKNNKPSQPRRKYKKFTRVRPK